jgi:hypothetical protein
MRHNLPHKLLTLALASAGLTWVSSSASGQTGAIVAPAPSATNAAVNALNPQPLPPAALKLAQPSTTSLNPQPLPPAKVVKPPGAIGSLNALNPQPLPPNARAAIAISSLQEMVNLSPETVVRFKDRELSVKALREQITVSKSAMEPSSTAQFKFSSRDVMSPRAPGGDRPSVNDAVAGVRDKLDRYAGGSQGRVGGTPASAPASAPAPWVKHDLPKSRWQLISCGNAHNDRHEINKCDGSDASLAQSNLECVAKKLANGVDGNPINVVFCNVYPSERAGAFHTKYDASNSRKNSGSDVYELRVNPQCRWEHWWTTTNSTASVESQNPSPGVIRAVAKWSTDRCWSARATFWGALIDEDYACVASYHNSVTKAECPAGVSP